MIPFIFKTAATVTASDTANIPNVASQDGSDNRGCFLYIGDALATLKVLTKGGQEITFNNPAVGQVLPVEVLRVYDTGTTAFSAGDVIALWR